MRGNKNFCVGEAENARKDLVLVAEWVKGYCGEIEMVDQRLYSFSTFDNYIKISVAEKWVTIYQDKARLCVELDCGTLMNPSSIGTIIAFAKETLEGWRKDYKLKELLRLLKSELLERKSSELILTMFENLEAQIEYEGEEENNVH